MAKRINLDGTEYDLDSVSEDARKLAENLHEINGRIQELQNLQAVFTRAKRSYIDELKREIVKGKSGVDIAALF